MHPLRSRHRGSAAWLQRELRWSLSQRHKHPLRGRHPAAGLQHQVHRCGVPGEPHHRWRLQPSEGLLQQPSHLHRSDMGRDVLPESEGCSGVRQDHWQRQEWKEFHNVQPGQLHIHSAAAA